jgi:hypothetical protein
VPKVSKDSASEGGDFGPVIAYTDHFDGYTADFVTFKDSVDHTPLFKGLPDDRCQCPSAPTSSASRIWARSAVAATCSPMCRP